LSHQSSAVRHSAESGSSRSRSAGVRLEMTDLPTRFRNLPVALPDVEIVPSGDHCADHYGDIERKEHAVSLIKSLDAVQALDHEVTGVSHEIISNLVSLAGVGRTAGTLQPSR
jgi:hypothetical protein